ncbi:MAG: hypothetical protein LBC68_00545 [Prevotellaceae bacterium]|jgi:hypothetical protein|nr:hypothetical protein [Prevotellaceae bacterium]
MKKFFANLPYGSDKQTLSKWQILFTGLGFFCFVMFLTIFCSRLYVLLGFDLISVLNTRTDISKEYGLTWYILFCIFIGPFREEIMLRLCLSFKKQHLAISLAFICMWLPASFIKIKYLSVLFFILMASGIFVYFMVMRCTTADFWSKIKEKYTKYIVWFLILVFTLLHLNNYQLFEWQYFVAYILILAQAFFLAVTATYFRINLGFAYCLLFHIAYNAGIILKELPVYLYF